MGDDRFGGSELRGAALSSTPLYIQLRDLMIDRIRSKAWRSGLVVPNELKLSEEFGVSVGTVRKAMQELDDRGLITRQQGRGTVISDRMISATAVLLDSIRRPDGSAFNWDAAHTTVRLEQAEPRQERLFSPLARCPAQLFHFEWILSADEQPIVLLDTAVPHELIDLELEMAERFESLDELFDHARILHDRTECSMSVAPADDRVAERLKVPSGTCLQRMERRLFDFNGRTIAISDDWLSLARGAYIQLHQRTSG